MIRKSGLTRGHEGNESMQQKNLCPECGGTLEKQIITHTTQWGDQLYQFENVPALVCVQSGHTYLDGSVAELIDGIIQHQEKPRRYEKVPVFSLPDLSGI